MAQQLKEEIKNKIIKAAQEEFLAFGFEEASLRNIAEKADISVGNLYNYFKNKDDINKFIVGSTLEALNDLVKKVSNQKLSFDNNKVDIDITSDSLNKMIKELSDGLFDIYSEHHDEFMILMLHSKTNDDLINWFKQVLTKFIDYKVRLPGFKKEKELMASAYAVAIFDGMKEIFRSKDINPKYLKNMVHVYMSSYVSMLDIDVNKMIGGLL